jgi:hypothetical protein
VQRQAVHILFSSFLAFFLQIGIVLFQDREVSAVTAVPVLVLDSTSRIHGGGMGFYKSRKQRLKLRFIDRFSVARQFSRCIYILSVAWRCTCRTAFHVVILSYVDIKPT